MFKLRLTRFKLHADKPEIIETVIPSNLHAPTLPAPHKETGQSSGLPNRKGEMDKENKTNTTITKTKN
jgi:hypothetical protein